MTVEDMFKVFRQRGYISHRGKASGFTYNGMPVVEMTGKINGKYGVVTEDESGNRQHFTAVPNDTVERI